MGGVTKGVMNVIGRGLKLEHLDLIGSPEMSVRSSESTFQIHNMSGRDLPLRHTYMRPRDHLTSFPLPPPF